MIPRAITLLAVYISVGCASADVPTLASRFVRQGTPTVDLGGPRPASRRMTPSRSALEDASITSNVSRTSSGASSLETIHPPLQGALMKLTLAPTVEHHLDVARAYRGLGIMDQAYDYLTRSLTTNGPHPDVFDERARLWRDWGHPEFGLADAYRAAHIAPRSAAIRNTLGTLLYRLGRTQEAEAAFREALTFDHNAWYALSNLCHTSLAQGRTREAIAQCQQAKALKKKTLAARKLR